MRGTFDDVRRLRSFAVAALALVPCMACSSGSGSGTTPTDAGVDATADAGVSPSVEIVGHADLGARGMNAAIAVAGRYVYVGSRTDGDTHANAGVMIVDAQDPAHPVVVGQIGAPEESLLGMSSRELRAVPDKNLLIVLNTSCSTQLHSCQHLIQRYPTTGGAAETDNLRFYDISTPTAPKLVARHDFGTYPGHESSKAHEFFLWRDPKNKDRILLFFSTPTTPSLTVLDVSDPKNVTVLATWDAHTDAALTDNAANAYLHSVSVSDDGNVAYLSYLAAGFFLVDTSDFASGAASPKVKVLTPMDARFDYTPPATMGTHSAVRIPGRDLVFLTDEVYPPPAGLGCPWGWARLVDISDPKKPTLAGEYKIAENDATKCPDKLGGPLQTTFTAHNPTVTENLALVTWHSGGLQIIDTTDPTAAAQLVELKPDPLPKVATEDPMFSGNAIEMWSYPVIQDGLVYAVDVRNGLYILRYHGPYEDQIARRHFLEGSSNLR